MNWEIGDIVEAFGHRGVVTSVGLYPFYPIRVLFEEVAFTLDGRLHDWHKTPSLKLIERPKKKNTRVFKEWINKEGRIQFLLLNEDLKDVYNQPCDNFFKSSFLQWTGREFEIEVDW